MRAVGAPVAVCGGVVGEPAHRACRAAFLALEATDIHIKSLLFVVTAPGRTRTVSWRCSGRQETVHIKQFDIW